MSEQAAVNRTKQPRRLLPAQPPPSRTTGSATRSRQNIVTTACSECRKHKIKCSGERPSCSRCVRRQSRCYYTTNPGETESHALSRKYNDLQRRAKDHEEILGFLRNLPDKDAQDVLQRIRSGTDLSTIVKHIKAGNLMLQMAVSPETRFRYEFPYKADLPEDYLRDNPYLDSMVYESVALISRDEFPELSNRSAARRALSEISDEYQNIYLKPFHAANVVDPQLSDVKVSSWTSVSDDDMLMRDLLGEFFRCEYQFTAAFQKDLFLEDMAAQRKDFCSSLLVNVVLGYACVCSPRFSNRAEYWNPHTLLYRFIAEAKRLWELEATEPRITTIQAGIIFSVYHNLCGLDEVGQAYRLQAIALAHKLHLFDGPINGRSGRVRRGKAFAAWALYNWETLSAFSFMFAPLLKRPPDAPLPDPSDDASWYGEIWVKYPLGHSLLPLNFSHVLRARSRFRIIMNEFCQEAYSEGSEVTLYKAYRLYLQLKSWFHDLSSPLVPEAIALPGHLQVHLYYHHLILTIFEPLLDMTTDQTPSPQQIVAEAKKALQTLIRLYYLRHGFDAMNLFIVIPLMLAGYDSIDAINETVPAAELEHLRSTIILVAKGLYDQRRNHYLAEALYRVIRGRMRESEVVLLREAVDLEDDDTNEKKAMMQAVRSHWPVSVVKKKEDMDSHILTNLVENYANLNVREIPEDQVPELPEEEE